MTMTTDTQDGTPEANALAAMKALREQGTTFDDVGRAFGIGGQLARRLLMSTRNVDRMREVTRLRLRRAWEARQQDRSHG